MSVSEVTIEELESALQSGACWSMCASPTSTRPGTCQGVWCRSQPFPRPWINLLPRPDVRHLQERCAQLRACEFLADQGLDAVNVEGGTMAWIISGRGTVAGDQPA